MVQHLSNMYNTLGFSPQNCKRGKSGRGEGEAGEESLPEANNHISVHVREGFLGRKTPNLQRAGRGRKQEGQWRLRSTTCKDGHMLISPSEARDQEFKSSLGCAPKPLKSQTRADGVGHAHDLSP